jgi:hypothetical protein
MEAHLSSLIIELQQNALDPQIEITSLLRKALVAARKLGVKEFEDWISAELHGYGSGVTFPDYRKVRGTLKVHNPYNGWCPLYMEDTEMAEALSHRSIGQPIEEIESLLAGKETGGYFHVPLPKKIEQQLMAGMEFPLQPALLVGEAHLKGIIVGIRNSIFDWALKLEEQGVMGEGMTFSKSEKEAASSITYQIENIFGQISHSQIQQKTKHSSQKITNQTIDIAELLKCINSVKESLPKLNLNPDDNSEADASISTIEAQARSSKPSNTIIKESLKSLKSILENIAGNVASAGLLSQIDKFIN